MNQSSIPPTQPGSEPQSQTTITVPSAASPKPSSALATPKSTTKPAPVPRRKDRRPQTLRDLESLAGSALPDDDDDDGTYQARKPTITVDGKRRAPSESPVREYAVGNNGLDLDESESEEDMLRKRRIIVTDTDDELPEDPSVGSKAKVVSLSLHT